MKTFVVISTAILLLFAGPGCKKTVTGPEFPTDYYYYTAFDTAAAAAVTGTVVISRTDSTTMTGSWNLRMVGTDRTVGPQVGLGSLHGNVSGDDVSIGLNPGMVDDNVILNGAFLDTGRRDIAGTWEWVTVSGVTARGTFTLIHK